MFGSGTHPVQISAVIHKPPAWSQFARLISSVPELLIRDTHIRVAAEPRCQQWIVGSGVFLSVRILASFPIWSEGDIFSKKELIGRAIDDRSIGILVPGMKKDRRAIFQLENSIPPSPPEFVFDETAYFEAPTPAAVEPNMVAVGDDRVDLGTRKHSLYQTKIPVNFSTGISN